MLTPKQLEIIQHALGADQYGRRSGDRNHFCAGGDDVETCAELVALGFARQFERSWLPYFNVTITEAGKQAMREQSPKPPKLTRAQKRYERFLRHDSGLSFGEWLKWYGKEASDE